MSTLAQVRAAVLAKLKSVSGIGQVHDYERYAADTEAFLALYKTDVADTAIVLGWFFYRESTPEIDISVGEVRRLHSWRIVGFRGWSDAEATAKSFDDLVEAIAIAFRTDRTLGGVVDDIKDLDNEFGASGIQIEAIEPVIFSGLLCHRARLRLITETTEPNT